MNVVEEIPLLKVLLCLFYSLRQYGLPLGVEDYMLVLRALQGGFGIGDRDSLERLCCTLWTKSEQEARLLHQLLGRAITNAPSSAELPQPVEDTPNPSPTSASTRPVSKESEEVMDSSTLPSTATPVGNISEQLEEKAPLKEPEIPVSKPSPLTDIPLEIDEPELVIQAIRHYNRSNEMISEYQDLAAQYLPVTPRQIKQSWRFLSRSVPQGISDKLNVPATVAKICQQCILIEAVLMPNYVNRVKLVLLVDQGGSMIPFHHLSRQLIDKARRGGNIEQASVYYFYNYPEIYFYSDPTRLKAQLITDILGAIDERAGVLMVSDAGAARSNYNPERIECTQRFIEQLRQSVRYYAWLNPMPNDSWQGTTAGEIARFVPMFEMSPQGFNAAINALRGRYVYGKDFYELRRQKSL